MDEKPFFAEYSRRLAGPWTDIRDQLPILYERASRYPQVRVVEFGVRTGESTSAFLAAAETTGGHVWSYDLAEPSVPAWWAHSGWWTFTRADSLIVKPPPCHVLFLDTSHAYKETLAELRRLVPFASEIVLCHDTRLADEPFEPYAVARALDTYWQETGLEWAELGGRYGLGEISIRGRKGRMPDADSQEQPEPDVQAKLQIVAEATVIKAGDDG